MLLNSFDNEKLFSKSVPVTIRDVYTNQSRTSHLFFTIEWQDVSKGMFTKKVLAISLTDNNDPFFLYNLHLSEEDFQLLKASQDLLISFTSFPQHIIDYIELCLHEENNPQPKFLLIFTINDKSGNAALNSQLDIIETNQFKHLTHLSLKFVAATDSVIRTYLVSCFRNLKEERQQLRNQKVFLEQDLKDKLAVCQHALDGKSQELELLRKELSVELNMKESKHAVELQEERNRLMNKLRAEEDRFEREIKEKEKDLRKQIKQLESRVSCLDTLNKELQDKNYKHESTIREIRSNLLSSEDEIRKLKENIHNYKRKYESLNLEMKSAQTQMNYKDEKINDLEQELSNKAYNNTRLKEQIDVDVKQRKSLEIELENVKLQLEMSEKSRKMLEDDKNKSYEVIRKLQDKVKFGLEKAKSKSDLSLRQEQKIKDQDNLLHNLQAENAEISILLQAKNTEMKSLNDTLHLLQKKIEELEKDLKLKDNAMKYLTRELSEHCIFPQYTPPSNFGPSPSSAAEKHLFQMLSPGQKSDSEQSPDHPTSTKTPKSQRNSVPSRMKSGSHFHKIDRSDSAYCPSPSVFTQATPNVNDTAFAAEEIDPKALSAAFGDPIPKHSTAKKQPNPSKSKLAKRR